MVTAVGTQINFINAVKELIELEYDALEAYEMALERLESPAFKAKLNEFAADHRRHISDLSNFIRNEDETPPTGPSTVKQWVTKGKVLVADMISDEAILRAMSDNETDTNTAYKRMNERDDISEEVIEVLRRNFEDEKRHKQWLEDTINSQK